MTTNLFNLRSTWLRKGASALTDQGLVAAAGFSTTILLGRWLPPAEYGAYALAFSVFLFLAGFHNALLLEPMSVLGPASYRNCLPAYLRSVLQLHFALTFLLAVSLSLLGACLKFWMPHSSVSAALLGVSIGTPWILLLWLGRRAAYLELKPTSALRGAATYAIALVALLFLFQRRQWLSPLTVFLLQAPAACLASAVIFASVVPRLKSRQTGVAIGTVLKQHWDYGRWVVATAFVYWITAGANYVMVGALLRMEDVGAFRSLQNFALPVPQFVTAMSLLLLPHASASFSQRGSIALRQNTKKFVFLFATGGLLYMVGLLFFGGWLFKH
ncbi:MAG: hypothetical protein HY237_05045, partial [Acidobacteria bacterium]|nr:hypothetical protein [Acidobacteriota bacterium]